MKRTIRSLNRTELEGAKRMFEEYFGVVCKITEKHEMATRYYMTFDDSRNQKLALVSMVATTIKTNKETITAIKSGRFKDPDIWDTKEIPMKGRSWVIPSGITVTYD